MIKQKISNFFKWVGISFSLLIGLAGIVIGIVFKVKYNNRSQEVIDENEEIIINNKKTIIDLKKRHKQYKKEVESLKAKSIKNSESVEDLIK